MCGLGTPGSGGDACFRKGERGTVVFYKKCRKLSDANINRKEKHGTGFFPPPLSGRLSGDAFELAQNHLLGAYLCSEIDGELTAGMITELEVYIGSCDKACHAWPNKKTPRTATMFKPGGCAYVFSFTACIISLTWWPGRKEPPTPF